MLGFNVKSSCNSILTVALAHVDSENKNNWLWFLKIISSTFSDIKLIISDKEKGMESWRFYTNQAAAASQEFSNSNKKSKPPLIVSLCASHAAKNGGANTRDRKSQGVSLAKAGNIGEKEYILSCMKRSACGKFVKYMTDHFAEYSWLNMQNLGLDTCFGDVTSNSSESIWHSIQECRAMPVSSMYIWFLEKTKIKCVKGKIDAKQRLAESLSNGTMVCSEHHEKVRAEAAYMYANNWIARIDDATDDKYCYLINATVGKRFGHYKWVVTLKVEKDTENDSNDIKWSTRITCLAGGESSCGHTELTGRPCKHSSFVLVYVKHLLFIFYQSLNMAVPKFPTDYFHYTHKR